MRNTNAETLLLTLAGAGLVSLALTSCTTTSSLSSNSASSARPGSAVQATQRIAPENSLDQNPGAFPAESAAETAAEAADRIPEAGMDAPAQERPLNTLAQASPDLSSLSVPAPELAAMERPVETRPPVTLTTVPLTSVESRPTNQIMMVRTTAYSHLQADSLQYGRKSAAGTDLKYGPRVRSAAADWSKYPLGTRFMIEGLPYEYVIDDYGSALCGTETIDIYKPDLSGIGKWGVRNVPVRVLEWGSFEESRKILDSRKHVRHAHHVRKMLSEIERKGKTGTLDRPASGAGGGRI